jgi:hypothetical protein
MLCLLMCYQHAHGAIFHKRTIGLRLLPSPIPQPQPCQTHIHALNAPGLSPPACPLTACPALPACCRVAKEVEAGRLKKRQLHGGMDKTAKATKPSTAKPTRKEE